MAGEWIKMRAALLQAPRLIALSRALHDNEESGRAFRDWLTPGGGGPFNGQLLSNDALRCVTLALLLRVWSASREFGHFADDDLILTQTTLGEIDVIAGAPGMGNAMQRVGWAVVERGGKGLTPSIRLPNFKQHNVPMSNAERQAKHRETVTCRNGKVTQRPLLREDKIREEKREEKNKKPSGASAPASWLSPFADAWQEHYGGPLPVRPALEPLAAVRKELGDTEALERWRRYLDATDAAFANPARFRATLRRWDSEHATDAKAIARRAIERSKHGDW